MSAFSGKLPVIRSTWTALVWVLVLSLTAFAAPAKRPIPGAYLGTVAIDPGHGGHDTGAKGAEGYHEKTVTLILARLISDRLQPDYRVILTRNADYRLDIPDRTAVANQEGADLFISIHAGGSYLKEATGLSVFYFKELLENPEAAEAEPAENEGRNQPQPWDTVQIRHQTASIELAGHFYSFFQNNGIITVNPIEGMPLLVLLGADMPAVLIEIGNLTHPLEGKSLKDTSFLSELADQIKNAIDTYIKKK
ncbi:MAG TPA: N-acetylmuramoyl-L-alanine amidase [Deltaproteobacteria bacterium]|nr:N-acetylmuramoyl-L-alanine amidase [Deltaproteobacteria bacterium]